jgi:hypothetical protein
MRIWTIPAAIIAGLAGAAGVHYLPQPWPAILILLGAAAGLPCLAALATQGRRRR